MNIPFLKLFDYKYLVEQELHTLPEHLSSHPCLMGLGYSIFRFMYMFCRLLFEETTNTASSASFLDLYLKFDDSGQLSTKIYDKRDDFNFKIINIPNMCSNIPASPAYCVYISQLIRYARASSNYSDFLKRHLHLRNRLLEQGY